MITNVKLKKLNPAAIVPVYGTRESAGADLHLCHGADVTVAPGETVMVHTGIALHIPEGLVGLVFARSGLAAKRGIAPANKVGVIDSDYRGEIMVPLRNHGTEPVTLADGERIAQLVFMPYIQGVFECVDDLSETDRGTGGFGSTGRV
ncbi:MAG: dUTP diphosphatase [Eubacteriales bacterium]|nr:dUTP diphosphatase [Eubacteriales bacterium]